jgi:hypothetical protein
MNLYRYNQDRYPYPFELFELGYSRIELGYSRSAGMYSKFVDRQEVEALVLEMSGIPADQFPAGMWDAAVPRDLRYIISYEWPAQIYINGSCSGTATASLNGVERGSQLRRVEKKVLRAWVRKLISYNAPFIKRRHDAIKDLHAELTSEMSESVRRLVATT